MSNSLGQKLVRMHVQEEVSVRIGGDKYIGNIIEINRKKCDLVSGFMEEGYIEIYLNLHPETVNRLGLSTECLRISATEDTPNDFASPIASLYDATGEQLTNQLGEVTEINS